MSKKSNAAIVKPEGLEKVLLHACCAPCSTAIVEWLKNNSLKPTIFYYNPNIFPKEEYDKRRDESRRHAEMNGIDWIEGEWDHEEWKKAVEGHEHDAERQGRCQICFNLRMKKAAEKAKELGLDTFTTTLASSRWKNLDQVNTAGAKAEAETDGTSFWAQNWRKGGLQERRNALIKEGNFYNQLYCGCEYSMRTKDDDIDKNLPK